LRVAINMEQLLSPSPGGIGHYAARLALGLSEAGVEVHPVVARHRRREIGAAWESFGLEEPGRVRAMALPRPLLYDSWHLLGWPPLTHPGEVDIVHAPSLAVPPRGGQPLVVSVHDAGPWVWPDAFGHRGRWFHSMGARAVARRADKVLTGTRAAAAELHEHMGLDEELVQVVAYGVDPWAPVEPGAARACLARYGLTGKRYVLWVGSLEPRKGVGTLVAAMARLHGRSGRGSVALVMVGYEGWANSGLVAPGHVATLGSDLHQLGRISDADLKALYASASVFALPSVHEGFGLPLLEAMAAGVPVVASDIATLREVAGGAAVLVPPGDVGAWACAVEAALALDGQGRSDVVARGRSRAEMFPWSRTVAATLEVYEQAIRIAA